MHYDFHNWWHETLPKTRPDIAHVRAIGNQSAKGAYLYVVFTSKPAKRSIILLYVSQCQRAPDRVFLMQRTHVETLQLLTW